TGAPKMPNSSTAVFHKRHASATLVRTTFVVIVLTVNLDLYFDHPEYDRPPAKTEQYTFTANPITNDLLIEMSTGTVTQIMIEIINASATITSSSATCDFNISEFHGCINCDSGANASYSCKTDFGTTTASLDCSQRTPGRLNAPTKESVT
ncbi:unnamed protein product, partial [Mesorhabditis spiculigera]